MTDQAVNGQQQQAPQGEREYTELELQKAVDDGVITNVQMLQMLRAQDQKRVQATISTAVQETVQQVRQQDTITGELDQYKSLVPDLMKEGSPVRQRAAREFERLTSVMGLPADLRTELLAAQFACGPLQRAKARGERVPPEAFNETGGNGGQQPTNQPGQDNAPLRGLTARQKDHYGKMIQKGVYADWKAVNAELSWKRGAPKGGTA